MPSQTRISIRENAQGNVVATDETTELQAHGDSIPTALTTLAEKLEIELLR